MADKKHEESFKVVDRRLFTPEGELREGAVEQERRDALEEATKPAKPVSAPSAPAKPPGELPEADLPAAPAPGSGESVAAAPAPVASHGFQVLVDFLAGNAAARLGMLPDPRTGQGFLDLEGANELIDMLDALREKTRTNLTHEEEQLLLEVLRSLKLSYLDMTKAAAEAMREEAKGKA